MNDMAPAFNIPRSGFAVRPAAAADSKACRMLLSRFPAEAELFVAVDGAHGLVVGAAGATRVPRTTPLVGPGVAVHVIEPCRRCGIGAALVDVLVEAARRRGAAALYSAQRVECDGDEICGWQRLGFDVCETVEEHELPLDQFVPRLAPVVDRLRQAGRIPSAARIVPLYAADPVARSAIAP